MTRGEKYSPEEIIAENLLDNSRDISAKAEIRLGIFDSILREFGLDNGSDISDNAELLRISGQKMRDASEIKIQANAPEISKELVRVYSKAVNVADKAVLCKLLCKSILKDSEIPVYKLLENEHIEDFDSESEIKIAYRKAHGADIAFEKFASVIVDAGAIYRDTFAGVCDSVMFGEADMCILPYENTSDGKLLSFYRLIESFDLKIAASCMVRSDDLRNETRYLLLSKSLEGLSELAGVTDFEFLLCDKTGEDITKVMGAASNLGLKILSIDTMKAERKMTVFDIRMSADSDTLSAFIIYLKLEAVSFSPLGLYAATI